MYVCMYVCHNVFICLQIVKDYNALANLSASSRDQYGRLVYLHFIPDINIIHAYIVSVLH